MAKRIILLIWLHLTIATSIWAQSAKEYINLHADLAQEIMQEHHIPASLILAVAIHESAAGRSKIAQHLNNHFGIKGPNKVKKIKSSYRSYDSVKESYEHFANLIRHKSYFEYLQGKIVERWVRKIHSGYARSGTWSTQVIQIINTYDLKQYDDTQFTEDDPNTPESTLTTVRKKTRIHVVKPGETLSEIARKYHTTVKNIKKKNNIISSKIKVGKRIKI